MLGVSHATALRNISRLEADLDIRLFERHQSGYRVTPQGEDLLPNALAIRENVDLLMQQAAGRNIAPEGTLLLQVPDVSLVDIGPLLADFRARYPSISIQTVQESPNLLAGSTVDVALALTNTPPEEAVGRQVARIEFDFYGADSYLSKPRESGEHDWIIWGSTLSAESGLNSNEQTRLLRRFSKRPNVVLQAATHLEALAAVRAGMGIGLLKKTQPELSQVPIMPVAPVVGLWILTHPELRRAGKVRAFMDFVTERYLATSTNP